jgi:hypothetical protein
VLSSEDKDRFLLHRSGFDAPKKFMRVAFSHLRGALSTSRLWHVAMHMARRLQ